MMPWTFKKKLEKDIWRDKEGLEKAFYELEIIDGYNEKEDCIIERAKD